MNYWRNPRKHAKTREELKVSLPEYYRGLDSLSEYMVEIIKRHTDSPMEPILELGCNSGRNLQALHEAGFQRLHGVEIQPEAVNAAWKWFPDIAGWVALRSIQDHLCQTESDYYHMIFTQGVLMHIPPEEEWIFEAMARVSYEYILINEVENPITSGNIPKFTRNYGHVFPGFDEIWTGSRGTSTTRLFKKVVH